MDLTEAQWKCLGPLLPKPRTRPDSRGREEFVVMVPSNHPAPSRLANIADVRGHPMVVLDELHCLGQQIQGFCSARRLAPRVTCRATRSRRPVAPGGAGSLRPDQS